MDRTGELKGDLGTTSTAGDDTFKATVATMNALDVIDGGAGTDILQIVDAADVLALPITLSGVEKLEVESLGSIGAIAAGAAAVPAVREIDQWSLGTFNSITYDGTEQVEATDTITLTRGTTVVTLTKGAGDTWSNGTTSYADAAAAIEAALNSFVAGSAFVADGSVYTSQSLSETTASASVTKIAYAEVDTVPNGTADADVIVLAESVSPLQQGGKFTVVYGGVTTTTAALDNDPTSTEALTLVRDAINAIAGDTVANIVGGEIVVTAPVAGTALPAYSVTYVPSTGVSVSTLLVKADSVANAAATVSTAQAAATFAAAGSDTAVAEVVLEAADEIVASAATTSKVTASSGASVFITGGSDVTIEAADSVRVSGAKGAVNATVVTGESGMTTAIPTAANTGWSEAAGVFIRGGTSVNLTVNDGKFSSGKFTDYADADVQIGSDPATAANNTNGAVSTATASGYPQAIGNLSSAPTGDVTLVTRTTGADTNGYTNVYYGAGAVEVFMNGGSTASITGAGTVDVADIQTTLTKASATADALPGTSKLATVNLTGVSGATSIKSDAIKTISAVDTFATEIVDEVKTINPVTITVSSNVGANTGAIALNVANSNVILDHDAATSVAVSTIAGSGYQKVDGDRVLTNSSTVGLVAAKATSLSFAGAGDLTLASSTLTALTAITATNSGKLNLGIIGGSTKLTSVDASAATGAITATYSATIAAESTDHSLIFKGGSGNDTVSITGTIKSATNPVTAATVTNTIELGAGNDVLLNGYAGEIAAGAVVDGGTGTDVVAASLLNSGNAALIKNFEVIGLDLTEASYDTDLLVGATGLAALALNTGTYTNVNTNQGLTYAKDLGEDPGAITLAFATAVATGTTDAYTVTFAGTASATATALAPDAVRAQTLVIEDIETVNVVSGGTGFVANSIVLNDADARKVIITGDKDLNIGFNNGGNGTFGTSSVTATDGLGVSVIDASAMTGNLTIDTQDVGVAYAGLTVKTGAGNDVVTLAGAATVELGAGNDTLTAVAKTTVTLGAGRDLVDVTATKLGTLAGTDATEAEATAKLVTIKDVAAGDKIDFIATANNTTAGDPVGAKTALSASTLAGALNALADASSVLSWGQYGGNTYVVFDASSSTAGGLDANDIVVKLEGLIDLTNAAFNSTTGVLTFG